MQHHLTTNAPSNQQTAFDSSLRQRVSSLVRTITVAEFWGEFDEPIEYLENPAATFAEDTRHLAALCQENGITYRHSERGLAFPVWLLREFYPENP